MAFYFLIFFLCLIYIYIIYIFAYFTYFLRLFIYNIYTNANVISPMALLVNCEIIRMNDLYINVIYILYIYCIHCIYFNLGLRYGLRNRFLEILIENPMAIVFTKLLFSLFSLYTFN